ncbi:hypothetical protein BV22DRAFT_1028663 [Leucogyrophana mollusca]|uniref:Uncharacterized protein n=1 Tax=Leucogyrophana mollusca TaxID=85980 RepID=A0ACB8BZM6_9AGAM|nr:hypothetical protein BV22DRAFT_1028663 [Leucogyrophana mollusca]
MIVPISVSTKNDNPTLPPSLARLGNDELCLIELQGSLDVECNESCDRDGRLVGKLNVDNPDKPTLLIGHHLLEGKIANLPKPLGVLQRNTGSQDSEVVPDAQEKPRGEPRADLNVSTGWTIKAVVKKKIVFSKRPMPITNLNRKP